MPTVITIHDMLYWSHPEFMVTPLYTRPVMWMEQRGAANAAHVITDSRGLGRRDRQVPRLPARSACTSFRSPRDHPDAPTRPPRARRTWSSRAASAGRTRTGTGSSGPWPWWTSDVRPRLVITGRPRRGPAARRWSPSPGWGTGSTCVAGWTEHELADLRARARAMAFPTLAEGFGLPVLEAMATGCPCIASDLPVLREVGGDAALWFDPLDRESIADAIRTVATEPELLLRGWRGGGRAGGQFSWDAGGGRDPRGVPARPGRR